MIEILVALVIVIILLILLTLDVGIVAAVLSLRVAPRSSFFVLDCTGLTFLHHDHAVELLVVEVVAIINLLAHSVSSSILLVFVILSGLNY